MAYIAQSLPFRRATLGVLGVLLVNAGALAGRATPGMIRMIRMIRITRIPRMIRITRMIRMIRLHSRYRPGCKGTPYAWMTFQYDLLVSS